MSSKPYNEPLAMGDSDQSVDFAEIFRLYLSRWYLFLLSVVISLAVGYLYIRMTPPIFTRRAEIMVKDDSRSNSIAGELSDLVKENPTVVEDEIRFLLSRPFMEEVVSRLGLDVEYSVSDGWRDVALYGTTQPIELIFAASPYRVSSVQLSLLPDGEFELSRFEWLDNEEERDSEARIVGRFGEQVQTPIGALVVMPLLDTIPSDMGEIKVSRRSIDSVVSLYAENLTVVGSRDKSSNSIFLSLDDLSRERADDMLNTLIMVYNENWVKDHNQVVLSTNRFIEERLSVIASTLGQVDGDLLSFRSEHRTPEMDDVIVEIKALEGERVELESEISMARYLVNYIVDDASVGQLLPLSSSISEANLSEQITSYNSLLLQRNRVLLKSSPTNPLVVGFDLELNSLRQAILSSMESHLRLLQQQLSIVTQREREVTKSLDNAPQQTQTLLSQSRQQSVMESIYLYLLQRREENQLNQAFSAYNTRLIAPPNGEPYAKSPIKGQIMLLSLLVGLVLPALLLSLLERLKSKVESRRDVERITSLPIVGSTPYIKRMPNLENSIVVGENKNDMMAEGFRHIRTNLDYMLPERRGVILVTSTHSNEGKSYLSSNLAISFSLLGKRTIVVGLDIRKYGLNEALGLSPKRVGLTTYLSEGTDDLLSLIEPSGINSNLDVICCGAIPPNPTELLSRGRMVGVVEMLRDRYDYVILDTAPVGMVTDTLQFSSLADLSLYVCRANHTHKRDLELVNEMQRDGRLPHLCVAIVGVDSKSAGYGYGYGYGYGMERNRKRKRGK